MGSVAVRSGLPSGLSDVELENICRLQYARWSSDAHEILTAIAAAITRIREAALFSDPPPKFLGAVIRNALSLVKSNRAVSVDNQSGYDLKELPPEAFDDLGLVFDKVADEGGWPMNGSFIPVSLIPKPDGGTDP